MHKTMRQDHTGRYVTVSEHALFMDALAAAQEGKANAKPSAITANLWQVATPGNGGLWRIHYVR